VIWFIWFVLFIQSVSLNQTNQTHKKNQPVLALHASRSVAPADFSAYGWAGLIIEMGQQVAKGTTH
jgi:hypothetical protein